MSLTGSAGAVRKPSVWGVQPPPPPPAAPPAAVPPPAGYASPPPPGRKRTSPWLWVLLGCGCLLVIIVIGAVLGGAAYLTARIKEEVKSIELPTSGEPAGSDAGEESSGDDAEAKKSEDGDDTSGAASTSGGDGPSEQAAIAQMRALCEKDWVIKVVTHSDDWKTVVLMAGPPQSEFIGEVEFQWQDNEYKVVREKSYESPSP